MATWRRFSSIWNHTNLKTMKISHLWEYSRLFKLPLKNFRMELYFCIQVCLLNSCKFSKDSWNENNLRLMLNDCFKVRCLDMNATLSIKLKFKSSLMNGLRSIWMKQLNLQFQIVARYIRHWKKWKRSSHQQLKNLSKKLLKKALANIKSQNLNLNRTSWA